MENNHNLSLPYKKALANVFDKDLKMEYANPYSPIKKCFDSRSNLVDHLNNLVDLDLLKKKTINGKKHILIEGGNTNSGFFKSSLYSSELHELTINNPAIHKMDKEIIIFFK